MTTLATFYTVQVKGLVWNDSARLFDDAVDQWIEAREQGEDAILTRSCASTGTYSDVTADAMERAKHFWNTNQTDWPEWAMSEDEIIARDMQAFEDIEHERIELAILRM